MKNFLVVAVIVGAGFFLYSGYQKNQRAQMTRVGSEIRIVKGNNDFLFDDGGQFTLDLRAFGINDNNTDAELGILSIITHLFLVTPMADNEEVFDKQLCERDSLDRASMINLMVEDRELTDKIADIRDNSRPRKCIRLSGNSLYMKRLLYKEQDHTQGWRVQGGKFNSDPYKLILMSDIEPIECS